jgi:hypothetical protein
VGILLSACAPAGNSAAPVDVGGGKFQPEVIFTGAIESMNGNQWVVNGQTITVDESVMRDGPFSVGDTVKVEAKVTADGSITAQRVETPSAKDAVEMSTSAPDNVSTPAPTQAPKYDDKGNEAAGTVDAITDTSITIGGQTYSFAPGAEIKGTITAGASVKLHFTTNADGTLSVTEFEIADPAKIEDHHSSDDHNGTSTFPDDHGGSGNTSDDGSNHNANDDHDGGSNSGGGDNSGGNNGSGG